MKIPKFPENETVRPKFPLFFVIVGLAAILFGMIWLHVIVRPYITRKATSPEFPSPSAFAGLKPLPKESKWSKVDPDVLDSAALEKIFPIGYLGTNNPSQEQIDEQRQKLHCLRDWATHSVPDADLRSSYLKWIDFYDGEMNRAEDRLLHPRVEPDESEDIAKRRKVRQLAAEMPTPEPCPLPPRSR
jgi:hypothetical protein